MSPFERTYRSNPSPHQALVPSPTTLQPANPPLVSAGAYKTGRHAHTSTNVWIHATLERSDSALKLRAAECVSARNEERGRRGVAGPERCAVPHLESEAAGAHVCAVRRDNAVFEVVDAAVLGVGRADGKVFEQSQGMV
jgi:hypothetical protein